MVKFQKLSERYLSRDDLIQLIEAILEASCDYLRVNTAFVASALDITNNEFEVIKTTGHMTQPETWPDLNKLLNPDEMSHLEQPNLHPWQSFWIVPLYSQRSAAATNNPVIGILGIEARSNEIDLTPDELQTLTIFVHRAAQALDDMLLQTEIYAALEGLLPQISLTRSRTAEVEFRPGRTPSLQRNGLSDRQQVIEQIHAALRHYWGGPGLSQSRLLELNIVQDMLAQTNGNAVKALREVLTQAIEKLRPSGERDMKSQEWMLYNIIQLRFIEKRKARETAQRLYMAEASLYRKQNVAIEAVADAIVMMEKEA
ncbi:MAG: hypothetical protein H7Y09_11365, partial [Chitinophagaceae bacterium]|nr:hypothetical protein [Anaerolineae bacterium]